MKEHVFTSAEGSIFLRHQNLSKNLPVLVLVHGLGESGLCFNEAFESPDLQDYTLIVPDMLGYGRSTQSYDNDYSMEAQVRRLWRLVDDLKIQTFFILGHSLGGDIAGLMAATDTQKRIQGLINVEGALTPSDTFFSSKILSAAQGKEFNYWFETEFKEDLVLKRLGNKWPSCRRYYASLEFARIDALLVNAREICRKSDPSHGRGETQLGLTYTELKIPKVFCWGSESLSEQTLAFLESHSLEHQKFKSAFHWPMIDQAQTFYAFVADFLRETKASC